MIANEKIDSQGEIKGMKDFEVKTKASNTINSSIGAPISVAARNKD